MKHGARQSAGHSADCLRVCGAAEPPIHWCQRAQSRHPKKRGGLAVIRLLLFASFPLKPAGIQNGGLLPCYNVITGEFWASPTETYPSSHNTCMGKTISLFVRQKTTSTVSTQKRRTAAAIKSTTTNQFGGEFIHMIYIPPLVTIRAGSVRVHDRKNPGALPSTWTIDAPDHPGASSEHLFHRLAEQPMRGQIERHEKDDDAGERKRFWDKSRQTRHARHDGGHEDLSTLKLQQYCLIFPDRGD